jgi:phosphohistidine phosphatase
LEETQNVKIYLLRHGTAEPRGPGVPEATRALTPEGKVEIRAVARQASETAKIAPDLILSSPFTRALETARIAGKAVGCTKIIETKSLLPDLAPTQIWNEIREHRDVKELLVAGHEPHLSRFAAFLLEAPVAVDMKKGALLRIDVQDREGPPRGVLKWMLTPRLSGAK